MVTLLRSQHFTTTRRKCECYVTWRRQTRARLFDPGLSTQTSQSSETSRAEHYLVPNSTSRRIVVFCSEKSESLLERECPSRGTEHRGESQCQASVSQTQGDDTAQLTQTSQISSWASMSFWRQWSHHDSSCYRTRLQFDVTNPNHACP